MGYLGEFLGRRLDRPMRRPAGLALAPDDRPPLGQSLGLALQHLAVQSIYFVLPGVVATGFGADIATVTDFLCLSLLGMALWELLQAATRGPLGPGYAIPSLPTPVMLGAYTLAAAEGGGLEKAAAMTLVAGLAAALLTFPMRRLRLLVPNEVAGVVVFLIGASLLPVAMHSLGVTGHGAMPRVSTVLVVVGALAVMAMVALSRSRLAPFGVLAGAALGVPAALALGLGVPDAAGMLAGNAWFALPSPILPRPDAVLGTDLLAVLLSLVAVKATVLGNALAYQRAADAGWSRADAPPLRRALLANGVAMAATGLFGGMAPGPSSAAVGLSIATGTLARRIVLVNAALLALLALCPKLVALFVLVPEPVKAAMLFYVSGFIMAQGCQLIAARLLDARRTIVAGFGLCAGLAVLVAPQVFVAAIPAAASPLSLGAMVAFCVNLATLPLVARRTEAVLPLDAEAGRALRDWCGGFGGAWGLRPATLQAAEQALSELAELLAERGVDGLRLAARQGEDRLELSLAWRGEPLPQPAARPLAQDLLGSEAAREGFAVWMATRRADGFTQRSQGGTTQARLSFED